MIEHRVLRVRGLLPGVILVLALGGCQALVLDPGARRVQADKLAAAGGFERFERKFPAFGLAGYVKRGFHRQPELPVRVYIEGDGKAWMGRRRISLDPTPVDPLGLRLALADPTPNVLYLGRPCQYIAAHETAACSPHLWGRDRFDPKVIAVMSAVIDLALESAAAPAGPRRLTLVGYSGGGVVAALIAAARRDVVKLITVAAPMDVDAWTRSQAVDQVLTGYSTAALAKRLAGLPQIHFAGARDRTVPPAIAEGYAAQSTGGNAAVVVKSDYTHHCCWVAAWPDLLRSTQF